MPNQHYTIPRSASKRTKNFLKLEIIFNKKFEVFWKELIEDVNYRKIIPSPNAKKFLRYYKQMIKEHLWELAKSQYFAETDLLGMFKPNRFIEKSGELHIQNDILKRLHFIVEFVLLMPNMMIQYSNMLYEGRSKDSKKEIKYLSGENISMNRILEVAHTKLKIKKKITIDIARKVIPEIDKIVKSEAEECRRLTGKINCSQLARSFGIDHKTAKSWCQKLGIPLTRPSLK